MATYPPPRDGLRRSLLAGMVIPAHPLALTSGGGFDERHQRALTRYYAAAGAGGVAVAVHTTQFQIRRPGIDLLEPVLRCAADTLDQWRRAGGRRLVRIAGVCGPTPQAVAEAVLASDLGYDAALVSPVGTGGMSDQAVLDRCRAVAAVMPIMGFYLQPDAGGRALRYDFWRALADVPNLLAVKIAPFDRYATLDVVRAVADAGRADDVALYTGNDDSIVVDLLTRFEVSAGRTKTAVRIAGGLLGHWAVWTRRAVEVFHRVRRIAADGADVPAEMLTLAAQVTDANAAVFDAANAFAGVIAGVQHILWRQGLLASSRCLPATPGLSAGQAEEIDRVRREYPHLIDDEFVAENLDDWLA